MSTPAGVRRLLLDAAPGERRGVVLLDGLPERLLIERDGEAEAAALGARLVGRLTAWAGDRAFVELPGGATGMLRAAAGPRPSEGAALELEVTAEAQRGKGPRLRGLGAAEGPPRPLSPGLPMSQRLQACAPDAAVETGPEAREAADLAQEAALAVEHRFRAGLTLWVEPTRALTAIDVDLAVGEGAGERRLREANLSALRHAVRLLRLKALAGVAVVDLVGFPPTDQRGLHRAEALRALAPDGEEATATAPDRLGLLQLVRPRRERPVVERLCDPDGAPSARTVAQRLARDFLREAAADPGGRLVAVAPLEVAEALAPLLPQIGPRLSLRPLEIARAAAHIHPA